jgi:hypothetical protein
MLKSILYIFFATAISITILKAQGNEIKEALERSVSYLEQQEYNFDYVFLYAYLQQQYPDLLRDIPQLKEIPSPEILEESDPISYLFYKLIDSDFDLTQRRVQQIREMQETDGMTLQALYCSQFNLDESYLKLLSDQADIGNYQASHALLSLIWLKQFACFSKDELTEIKQKLIAANWLNIRSAEDWTDLKVESMALLQVVGEQLEKSMIEGMMKGQNEDGGFPMKPDTLASHPHTTILAIWVLLLNL